MKKLVIIAPAALLLLGLAGPVLAQDSNSNEQAKGDVRSDVAVRPVIELTVGARGNVHLVGTIASVSSASIGVNSWGGVWVVDTTNAKLVRRFGGASNSSEFQVGDRVEVNGTINTNASWSIAARTVRDDSIQARGINPIGTISNVTSNSFTLSAKDGKTYSVTTDSNTKITLNGASSTLVSLLLGVNVRVEGTIDRNNNSILASRVSQDTRTTLRGMISNLSSTGFTLTTSASSSVQVTLASNAVVKLNGNTALLSNLTVGERVSATGTWTTANGALLASKVFAGTILNLDLKEKDRGNQGLHLGQ